MTTFAHSGDLGDIIGSLPTVRALGGGDYIIGHRPGKGFGRESMEGGRFNAIKPLLEVQPYIKSVRWGNLDDAQYDFSRFRHDQRYGETLAEWQARHFGVQISLDPWLTVEPAPDAPSVVFSRSERYHNPLFPWKDYIRANPGAVFVGARHEHAAFEAEFRCRVAFQPTANLLSLARIIAGAGLFVGNQSCPFWIAAGLGVSVVQETHTQVPDSIILRDNAEYPVAPEFLKTRKPIAQPTIPAGSNPMNVIIPFCKHDKDQAIRLVHWILELGEQRDTRFFLMTQPELQDQSMLPSGWEWLTDWNKVESGWSIDMKDASGPNSMWRAAAREMSRRKTGPWLWLEPDAIPCREDWMAAIRAEYATVGKSFMGALVHSSNQVRMSGVAVYPENTTQLVSDPFFCDPIPFDQAGASQFLRNAHTSDLFVDQCRSKPFQTDQDFHARVSHGAAVFHGCKDGSIISFLRKRIYREKGGETKEDAQDASSEKQEPTETFAIGLESRLNWIIENATTRQRRSMLYEALKNRGIECGRRKRGLNKQETEAS